MYKPRHFEKFRELFFHTIFDSMLALLKKSKEIKDDEDEERNR